MSCTVTRTRFPARRTLPWSTDVHAECAADRREVFVLSLVGERRRARGDAERLHLRERHDDVVGDAVAEILVVRIAAHVRERQHRDRRRRRRGR